MATYAGRVAVAALAAGLSLAGPQAFGTAAADSGGESAGTAATSGAAEQRAIGHAARSARVPRAMSTAPGPVRVAAPADRRAVAAAAERPSAEPG